MRTLVRLPLALLAALAVVLGLTAAAHAAGGAARAEAVADQAWGFVDAPDAVSAGWEGPLTVAWRNASDDVATYDVELVGSDLPDGAAYAEVRTIRAEGGASFREELTLPALVEPGTYTARLSHDGVDLVSPVEIVVRRAQSEDAGSARAALQVLDLRRGAVSGPTATFRVSQAARVSATVLDRRGRTVSRLALGVRPADRTLQARWDGRDGSGRRVAGGLYTLRVTAVADGSRASGTVTVRVAR